MALDFTVKDVSRRITAKFVHAFLPDAKKPRNLRAVFQPELDIHGISSKAEAYNIKPSPKVIKEDFTADGYKIKTPRFNSRIRLPGEYEGAETSLVQGAYPEVRMQPSLGFRNYISEKVKVEFDGVEDADGIIAEALDEKTSQIDEPRPLKAVAPQ
jgi:hypothetical protein